MEETVLNTEIEEAVSEEPVKEAQEELTEEFALDYAEEAELISRELPAYICEEAALTENERYLELRALGLTPKEAFLATAPKLKDTDNRSHLIGAVPKSAAAPRSAMTRGELEMARSVFGELDDAEIRRLYKKVTN